MLEFDRSSMEWHGPSAKVLAEETLTCINVVQPQMRSSDLSQ